MIESDPDRIRKLAAEGKVTLSSEGQEYFQRAGVIASNPTPEDWQIVKATMDPWGPMKSNQGGVAIHWQSKRAGFGSITLWIDSDGELHLDHECMSQEFCLRVFKKLLEGAKQS